MVRYLDVQSTDHLPQCSYSDTLLALGTLIGSDKYVSAQMPRRSLPKRVRDSIAANLQEVIYADYDLHLYQFEALTNPKPGKKVQADSASAERQL